MSPLASLSGSHQPRPLWLTIRISPSPRRYFRLARELSARSSRHTGGSRSSNTAQLTLAFSRSMSLSCSLMAPCSSWDRPAERLHIKFLFCSTEPPDTRATAKPARDKGVRSTGAQSATYPGGVPGTSGSAGTYDGVDPDCGSFLCIQLTSFPTSPLARGIVTREGRDAVRGSGRARIKRPSRVRSASWRDAPGNHPHFVNIRADKRRSVNRPEEGGVKFDAPAADPLARLGR